MSMVDYRNYTIKCSLNSLNMSFTHPEWHKNSGILELVCTSLRERIVKFLGILQAICETGIMKN